MTPITDRADPVALEAMTLLLWLAQRGDQWHADLVARVARAWREYSLKRELARLTGRPH